MRAALLALAIAASPLTLTGCALPMVQTAAPTYEQTLGTAYVTLAEVTKLAVRAVQTDRMTIEQATEVRDSLRSIRQALDMLSFAPDAAGLDRVQRVLAGLEAQLEAMQ